MSEYVRVQKSDAGVGIGTLVGANAPTPPYGGGLAPPHPLKVGLRASLMAINDRDYLAHNDRDYLAQK